MSKLPEAWTGDLIGRMHNAGVQQRELANEMGCTRAYVSMILNGIKKPPLARERLEAAFASVMLKKQKDEKEAK